MRVLVKIKHRLLPAVFFAFLLLIGSCATTAKTGELLQDNSGWLGAEIRVSDQVTVRSFNGQRLNMGPGSIFAVPPGKHTIEVGQSGFRENVSIEYEFLPGNSYIIQYQAEGVTTETTRDYRITTFHGNISIREYGASRYPVPGRNESILVFTLTGSYTQLSVDGKPYLLSSYEKDAASKLFIVLPSGKHLISSIASVGGIELDLPPNRFLSFNVNTGTARITQTNDSPLNYLGRWRFDMDSNSHIVITFSLEGMGYLQLYRNGDLQDGSGAFTYTASNSIITVTDSEVPSIPMRYQITPDQNSLSLEKFWGSQMDISGTRF